MSWVLFVYRFLGALALPVPLERRIVGCDLEEAARRYGFDARGAASSSFWSSLLVGGSALAVLLRLDPGLALVVSFGAAYLCFKYSVGYLPRRLRSERYLIAKHSGSVLDEVAFVLETTGSIFEAMEIVASSGYPVVSAEFRGLCGRVANGEEPEAVLLEYSRQQPSTALREGLVELVSLYASSRGRLDDLATRVEREARGFFREFFFQTEARLTIFFGVLFFFPVVLALVLAVFNLASSALILLAVPAQIMLAEALSSGILRSQAGLVG